MRRRPEGSGAHKAVTSSEAVPAVFTENLVKTFIEDIILRPSCQDCKREKHLSPDCRRAEWTIVT